MGRAMGTSDLTPLKSALLSSAPLAHGGEGPTPPHPGRPGIQPGINLLQEGANMNIYYSLPDTPVRLVNAVAGYLQQKASVVRTG